MRHFVPKKPSTTKKDRLLRILRSTLHRPSMQGNRRDKELAHHEKTPRPQNNKHSLSLCCFCPILLLTTPRGCRVLVPPSVFTRILGHRGMSSHFCPALFLLWYLLK
mmetsp:Transcript_22137/g.87831  ORF Transcript_22137/g.87831 Transcript_22137/m.87831 type:complete len:107 (+) Transcript_22137:2919-3239(+)